MTQTNTPIKKYLKESFTASIRGGHTITHDVYILGKGAPVILIQELPGIGIQTLSLADELVSAGFQVVLPHLFGKIGTLNSAGNLIRVFCMRKEFHIFANHQSSPVTDWLRALCRDVKSKTQAKGVGVIGMCLTGNFAISMMTDESVLAAVASQPSLPGHTHKALHISPEEVEAAKKRLDEIGPMLAYRFEKDMLCSATRFRTIDQVFNQANQERIKLQVLPGKGHSVLTLDFVNQEGHPTRKALDEILDYFTLKLK
ncbi:MAG: dienelactone hydrolase family protein [Microscillaceae bacterium]|nr:dienelactone hydrolase family protein [Microscillaceae bacterium]